MSKNTGSGAQGAASRKRADTFRKTDRPAPLGSLAALETGGGERVRTDDPLLAKQVLSQLSYTPVGSELVGQGGLEPPTSRLSSARSNQLSY